MTRFIQVVTTVDDKHTAEKIAQHVLEKNLAACVQILACDSMYRWQGRIENAMEYCCIIKSRSDLFDQLELAIKNMHPYEVPEILATEVIRGGENYLAWLDGELLNEKSV